MLHVQGRQPRSCGTLPLPLTPTLPLALPLQPNPDPTPTPRLLPLIHPHPHRLLPLALPLTTGHHPAMEAAHDEDGSGAYQGTPGARAAREPSDP